MLIDETAMRVSSPRILSVGCGHLREAALSHALQEGRIKTWVGLDSDSESLGIARKDYGHLSVHLTNTSVQQLLRTPRTMGSFHFIYAAGLYDYIPQRFGRRLMHQLFSLLYPGGRLLITNFVPQTKDVGYMECFMDWHMIYRNHREMLDLTSSICPDQISHQGLETDCDNELLFLEMEKKAN